jgi:hypothetical protein
MLAGYPAVTGTIRTKHLVLKQLEALARIELQQLRSARGGNDAPVADDSLIWLGLAWDIGLAGCGLEQVVPSGSPSGLLATEAACEGIAGALPRTKEAILPPLR